MRSGILGGQSKDADKHLSSLLAKGFPGADLRKAELCFKKLSPFTKCSKECSVVDRLIRDGQLDYLSQEKPYIGKRVASVIDRRRSARRVDPLIRLTCYVILKFRPFLPSSFRSSHNERERFRQVNVHELLHLEHLHVFQRSGLHHFNECFVQ